MFTSMKCLIYLPKRHIYPMHVVSELYIISSVKHMNKNCFTMTCSCVLTVHEFWARYFSFCIEGLNPPACGCGGQASKSPSLPCPLVAALRAPQPGAPAEEGGAPSGPSRVQFSGCQTSQWLQETCFSTSLTAGQAS